MNHEREITSVIEKKQREEEKKERSALVLGTSPLTIIVIVIIQLGVNCTTAKSAFSAKTKERRRNK